MSVAFAMPELITDLQRSRRGFAEEFISGIAAMNPIGVLIGEIANSG